MNEADTIGIGDTNYFSIDGTLRYYYGNYDLTAGAWIGEQIFAVKNGGFVVYNLTEKYKGGIYGEVGYTFRNGIRVAFDLSISSYYEENESDTNQPPKPKGINTSSTATQTVAVLSVGYKF
ncbi:MAG: hypothetical protein ABGX27_08120 [Desulfurobacteriaceae bacterium]